MSIEAETLVASFRATVMQETLNHRGSDVGLVTSFTKNVRTHQARYGDKLDNMRSDDSRDAAAAQIDAAEAAISKIADETIQTAESAGRVEVA